MSANQSSQMLWFWRAFGTSTGFSAHLKYSHYYKVMPSLSTSRLEFMDLNISVKKQSPDLLNRILEWAHKRIEMQVPTKVITEGVDVANGLH
jgi:hypothetical protein